MLIRVAIGTQTKKDAQELTNRLVSFSIRSTSWGEDIDFDFSYYADLQTLRGCIRDRDMCLISYGLLEKHASMLPELYKGNPSAFCVPMGMPEGKICEFLALRPAGHLRSPADQAQIDKLCLWCAGGMADNEEILQFKTRQGFRALTASSVLYCQSDQKYVMILSRSGEILRKLDTLDQLALSFPDYFVRVHQRYLVNARRITALDRSAWEITLDSGHRIPVSRVYQKTIPDLIQKYLSGIQK